MTTGEVYRTPDERFASLPDFPFEPRYVEQDGLRMHYVDEGEGKPLLLVHGTPSWSFEYRELIRALRGERRTIAADHLGFGLSDRPAEFSYTLPDHTGCCSARASAMT